MTAQVHENLILKGRKTSMAFCPPLPEGHPRIVELDIKDAAAKGEDEIIFSTDCSRRYIGTWEIKEKRFYLVKVIGRYKMIGKRPLFAGWFTGVIRIPRGKMLHYVHMRFGSVFEKEVHIKIENGKVVRSAVIDNRKRHFDPEKLIWDNLPGGENRFDGDDDRCSRNR
jgi:hypothetical protein